MAIASYMRSRSFHGIPWGLNEEGDVYMSVRGGEVELCTGLGGSKPSTDHMEQVVRQASRIS